MKYTLPTLLVLGLLVGCEQNKPAAEPAEADSTEAAKISADTTQGRGRQARQDRRGRP